MICPYCEDVFKHYWTWAKHATVCMSNNPMKIAPNTYQDIT